MVPVWRNFLEKGVMTRLNSAPAVSGTLKFNKKKKYANSKKNSFEKLETIAENFNEINFFMGTKEVINDEIDDLRKGLLGIDDKQECS